MSLQVSDTIKATPRPEGQVGKKGYARKLRQKGFVPVAVYGPGSEALNLVTSPKDFGLQLARFGGSHIYKVDVEGKPSFRALVKAVQRDYLADTILHVDLYAVDATKPIRVEIPVHLVGKAKGLVEGGVVTQQRHHVEVTALPDKIPEFIEHDVSELGLGDSVHESDLKLPEGVSFTAHGDLTIATCAKPEEADLTAGTPTSPAEVAAQTGNDAAAAKDSGKK